MRTKRVFKRMSEVGPEEIRQIQREYPTDDRELEPMPDLPGEADAAEQFAPVDPDADDYP
jgi:hypothetical protein